MNELKKLEIQFDKKRTIKILDERLDLYNTRYANSRQMLLHLIPFIIHLLADKKRRKVINPSGKRLKILIDIGEGLGGMVISLNWVCYFYNKFCKGKDVDIDCSSFNKKILDSFVPGFVKKTLSPATEKGRYDLKIFLVRCPQVVYANFEKIKQINPELFDAVTKYISAEEEYGVFFRLSYKRDAITYNVPSTNVKRWHQPDILDLFNITEDFILPIEMPNEETILKKFKLEKKKYITVNREVGIGGSNSTKLWPMENYLKVIEKLKVSFPQYTIVEVGTGKGTPMKSVHHNLAGKTSLDEIKVVLKNSLLHIDGEGGLVHLRHALKGGVSCVLFGPSSPEVLGYSENINLLSSACPIHCEFYHGDWLRECVKNTDCVCMKALTPSFVFSKIGGYLSTLK